MNNFKLQWYAYGNNSTYPNITIDELEHQFAQDSPSVCAFDTETTGLNIMKDKPFLIIFSYKVTKQNIGKVFVLEYTPEIMNRIFELMLKTKYIVGANTKYDLHMVRNGGSPFPFDRLVTTQLTDIQIVRRLTLVTDPEDPVEGEKMSLKYLATKLINSEANGYENDIKTQLAAKNRAKEEPYNIALKPFKWTINKLDSELTDPLFRAAFKINTPIAYEIYKDWKKAGGKATYYDIFLDHPASMEVYASYDGIYTLEVFLNLYEQMNIEVPEAKGTFRLENSLIEIYYEQEKTGIKIDLEYAKKSIAVMRDYIVVTKQKLWDLLGGRTISENQHKVLLEILQTEYGVPQELFLVKGKVSLSKDVLTTLTTKLTGVPQQICELVGELRALTKKLTTDLCRIYDTVMENGDGRLHPNSNSTRTVSGRISGDLQQAPREGIKGRDGTELFSTRKLIIPSSEEGYGTLVFQDFDQMELRVTAFYTHYFQCLDVNLSKLFVPLGCIDRRDPTFTKIYNIDDPQDKLDSKLTDGSLENHSIWWDPTTQNHWVPIDPHGMHVKTAFGIDERHKEWKKLRGASKTINFAVNYGSSLKGLLINQNLKDFSPKIIENIYNAYKENFKGVVESQNHIKSIVTQQSKISNIYGRVYRFQDKRSNYKACNYIVQGSCADLLKSALIKLHKLFKEWKVKSRVLYTIHDELMWELYNGEEWLIEKVRDVLQNEGNWSVIPIDCGTSLSTTNWYEKKEI